MLFLDHRMPGMDGMETLQARRGQQEMPCAGTPIIALTANAVAGAREEYLAAGFDDYLTKSIDSQRLEECLLRFLPADKVEKGLPQEGQKEERYEAVLPDWLREVADLDIEAGINHCGSAEAYLTALTVFAGSLPAMAAEISSEELAEAWESLREVAQAFDYDSLSYILTELSQYALLQADEARLQAVRQAADRLAWEEICKLTGGH